MPKPPSEKAEVVRHEVAYQGYLKVGRYVFRHSLHRGGMSEVLTPEGARDFLDLVPHAEFADIAGADHMVAGDRNDAFNDAVVDFLTAVRSS